MITRFDNFYRRQRAKLENRYRTTSTGTPPRWLTTILAIPDTLHLLLTLFGDRHVPLKKRAIAIAALTYIISPIDFIPAFIFGPLGSLDDLALTFIALRSLLNDIDQTIVYQHWAGSTKTLFSIQKIVSRGDAFIGRGLIKKIRAVFSPAIKP